jgi:MFS family permease
MIFTACIPLGLASGGVLPVWAALVGQAFGAADYGRAFGLVNPVMMPFTFTAPPAAGWVFDTTGNYDLAFGGFLVALLVAALVLLPLRLPARRPPS